MSMSMMEIETTLKQLRLSGVRATLETRLLESQASNLSFMETFSAILQDELDRRQSRLLERRYQFSGLDERASRQRGDADRGAGGIRLREIRGHDLVHLGKMREIGEIHVQLDRIGERPACGLGDRPQVREHAMDLRLDAFDQLAAPGIQPDLSGQIDRVSRAHGLGIGSDGRRGVVGADDDSGHGAFP